MSAIQDLTMDELRSRRTKIWDQEMKPIVIKGQITKAEREAYDKYEAELDQVDARIKWLEAEEADRRATQKRSQLLGLLEGSPIPAGDLRMNNETDTEYREAFTEYLRHGMPNINSAHAALIKSRQVSLEGEVVGISGAEFRALGTTTGAAGGFTIPEGFVNRIREAEKAFGGLRNAPVENIVTTSGNDLPYPNDNDTTNTGAILVEGVAATEQDVVFGQKVLKAWTWTSKIVRVQFQLLQDSGIDIEGYLAKKLGQRLGRAQAPYLVTGTGTNEPEGIVTSASTGVTTTTGQTTSFIRNNFLDMEASVDPAYWDKSVWVVSPSALTAIRKVVDNDGKPMLIEDTTPAGSVRSLLGYRLYVGANMATVAATNKPVLFGDVSGYAIRDVRDMYVLRLSDRYAEYGQVAFLVFSRMDARKTASDNSYKVLVMAAS